MLRTTAGLGPYLVICADCMLATVYIAVLVCTDFLFTLISPFRLSLLFFLTCLIVCSHPSCGFVTVSSLANQQEISILERCVSYVRSSLLSLFWKALRASA